MIEQPNCCTNKVRDDRFLGDLRPNFSLFKLASFFASFFPKRPLLGALIPLSQYDTERIAEFIQFILSNLQFASSILLFANTNWRV